MFVFIQNGISNEVSICSQSFQTKASFVEMLYFPAPSFSSDVYLTVIIIIAGHLLFLTYKFALIKNIVDYCSFDSRQLILPSVNKLI